MNHLKLTMRLIIKRIIRKYFTFILFLLPVVLYGQKDCNRTHTGLVPLTDLGKQYYRSFQGGLYENGTNSKPAQHKGDLLIAASQLQKLDTSGNTISSGKIVMIGVGASNPRTEFDEFMKKAKASGNLNPSLVFANTCIGGQGVQKMNDLADNYWKQAYKSLDSLGLGAKQVQVAWIETENTQSADTVFPRAPQTLVNDLNQLLKTLLIKFPNLKICYFSPRAYSGYAVPIQAGVGKGLLFPRDYYNGWAGKWLVEKINNRESGFEFSGTNKVIPLCTFGSYHWSDGSKKRNDSFYLDCTTEVGGDGLHLSEAGEVKIAGQMFDFFSSDSLAKQWFLNNPSTSVLPIKTDKQFLVYPNPFYDNRISIKMNNPLSIQKVNITLTDITGKEIFKDEQLVDGDILNIYLQSIEKGVYWLNVQIEGQSLYIEKLIHL